MSRKSIEGLIKIGDFSARTGVSQDMLRKLHDEGKLIPAFVTEGGTRYYAAQQASYFGITIDSDAINEDLAVGYCCVVSDEALQERAQGMKSYMLAKGYRFKVLSDKPEQTACDTCSDAYKQLLDMILQHEVSKVVLMSAEDVRHMCFAVLAYLCEKMGVKIEIIDKS